MTLGQSKIITTVVDVSLVTEAVTSGARGDTGGSTHPRADIMTDMGKVTRALSVSLLLALVVWPSTGSTASSVPAPSGCGPAPTALENPPEMARVEGRIQSIELEIRQDSDRLCFVDRNNSDRPGIAPTIRIRPGEILRVRLFNRINDASVLRKTTPPGHATNFPAFPTFRDISRLCLAAITSRPGTPTCIFTDSRLSRCRAVRALRRATTSSPRISFPRASRPRARACQSAYEIAVPDDHPAGLYWYHTHFHGESEAQTLLGLSGAIVVENADDDARRRHGIADRILIVRDHPVHRLSTRPHRQNVQRSIRLAMSIVEPATATRRRTAASGLAARLPQCAFGKCINTAAEVQCSAPADREQQTFLSVNGISIRDDGNPAGSVPEVGVVAGREELWRLVNAAADTYVRLRLDDIDGSGIARSVPIEVVGLDGVPFADNIGRPTAQMSTDPIMVPPGGRVEFHVGLDASTAQHRIVLRTAEVETGCSADLMPARDLVAVRNQSHLSDVPSGQGSVPPRTTLQRIDDMPSGTHQCADGSLLSPISAGEKQQNRFLYHGSVPPGCHHRAISMDGAPSSVVEVETNSVEEWTILNFTHELHNFHIHQLHFRVLESDDKFVEGRMLDTINVPVALPDANWSPDDAVMPGKVRLLMRFTRTSLASSSFTVTS